MPTTTFEISNKQLHKRGVRLLNDWLHKNNLKVSIASDDKYELNRDQTDLLVIGEKTGIRYELRVPTTERDTDTGISKIGPGYCWLMNEGNAEISDPHFIYCFTLDKKDTDKSESRIFLIPSPVVANFLRSAKVFLKKETTSHFQTFLIGHKDVSYPPSVAVPLDYEYENNLSILQ